MKQLARPTMRLAIAWPVTHNPSETLVVFDVRDQLIGLAATIALDDFVFFVFRLYT
jgi:hypothetical protein